MRRCPNCGFYNFDISEACGRCETLLANSAAKKENGRAQQDLPITKKPSIPKDTLASPTADIPKQDPVAVIQNMTTFSEAEAKQQLDNKPPRHKQAGPMSTAQKLARLELELATMPTLPAGQEGDIVNELPKKNTDIVQEAILSSEEAAKLQIISSVPHLAGATKTTSAKESVIEVTLPSFFRRLGGTFVDAVLLSVALCGAFIFTLSAPAIFDTQVSMYYGIDRVADLLLTRPEAIAQAFIITALFAILYHGLLVAFIGRTLGQALLGMNVKAESCGQKPGFFRSILRGVILTLSTLFLGIGIFWRILDPLRRDLGDLLTGTVVVKN